MRSSRLGIGDGLTQCRRHAIATANDAQAHSLLDTIRGFGEQVFVQQSQDGVDLGWRPLPVRRGKSKQGERFYPQSRSRRNDAPRRLGAGAMPGRTGQAPGDGPTAVAIRDDGDVQGASRGKLMRNLSGLLQDNGRRLHVLLSKGTGRYCYKLLCIAKYRSKKNSPLLTLARSPNQRFHMI